MAEIPQPTQKDLEEWFLKQQQLKQLKQVEYAMRCRLFGHFFPSPKEGTNSVPLDDGYVLKGKHSLNRDIDIGVVDALRDEFAKRNIPVDALLQFKPSLVLREYRQLTEEERQFFDQALIIKPGAPAMEIVMPAKNRKKEPKE